MRMKILKAVPGIGVKGDVIEVGGDTRAKSYMDRGIAEEVHVAASRVPQENKPPTPTVTHRQVTRTTQRMPQRRRR